MSGRKVIRYDRTRRKRHWSLGDPPRSGRAGRPRKPGTYLKRLLVIGIGAVLVLPYGADAVGLVAAAPSTEGCRIARVVDGDTVTIWCPDTGWERTRIIGFDTPEKYSPECAQEFAAALTAEWALRKAIFEAERLDVQRGGVDRYDRRLARILVDGGDVADHMVEAGHARAYRGGRREGWCG